MIDPGLELDWLGRLGSRRQVGMLGESWAGRLCRGEWEGSGSLGMAAEAWLKALRAHQAGQSHSQWELECGAGTVPGFVVTRAVAKGPKDIPVWPMKGLLRAGAVCSMSRRLRGHWRPGRKQGA